MNQRVFRLVFNRQRNMFVAVAECCSARGKASLPRRLRLAALLLAAGLAQPAAQAADAMSSAAAAAAARAARLPVGFDAASFASLGRANTNIVGTNPLTQRLVVNQLDNRVILNWHSFNIGHGNTVQFVQPTGGSALNRIHGVDPSVIMGRIEANAEVILYNANGLIFGPGARVDVQNFVATTLNISDTLYQSGFRGLTNGQVVFGGDDANINGYVRIENGAEIRTPTGGDVMVFAPRVLNEGRIEAPAGQVRLAAGQKVYIGSSRNQAERGFLVEVDPFVTADKDINTVTNARSTGYKVDAQGNTVLQGYRDENGEQQYRTLTDVDGRQIAPESLDPQQLATRLSEIVTQRGSTSVVGLAVRQLGTIRATTAVKGQNGGIYLLAHGATRADPDPRGSSNDRIRVANTLGTLEIGEGSLTEVIPESSGATQLDAENFYSSVVRGEGQKISVGRNAVIRSVGGRPSVQADGSIVGQHGGIIELKASADPARSAVFGAPSTSLSTVADASRIVIAPNALLDVSGVTDVVLDMSRNVITGQLFSIELADSPLQRTGVLYRESVSFDARKDVDVADVSRFYGLIARDAQELSTRGGSISIQADGDVIVGQGATLDVSGGSVRYTDGTIATTQVRSGNRVFNIEDAPRDLVYDAVLENKLVRFERGYVEGKDAGSVDIAGRRVVFDGKVSAGTVSGAYQRGDYVRPSGSTAVPLFDQHRLRPLGGSLTLGRAGQGVVFDQYLGGIRIVDRADAVMADSFFATPFSALPTSITGVTTLSATALKEQGVARLNLFANGLISVDELAVVDLGAYGSFSADAARVVVDGTVRAASGDIALQSRFTLDTTQTDYKVVIGEGGRLSAAGAWTNDGRAGSDLLAPVALEGGSVQLSSVEGVTLAEGSVVDVSAGAWHRGANRYSTGDGGAITVSDTRTSETRYAAVWDLALAGELRGYGFRSGGDLVLSAGNVWIADAAPAGGLAAGTSLLTPSLFSSGGFQTIAVNAAGDIDVLSGTVVAPVLSNLQLQTSQTASVASGDMSDRVASVGTVFNTDRKAVSLSLSGTLAPLVSAGADGSRVTVHEGARIETEAGGKVSLSATRSLTVAGTLSAPGGELSLTLSGRRGGSNSEPDALGFLADQAIWLTPSARLLAQGTSVVRRDASGRLVGSVFGGGAVRIDAQRGYVVAEADSVIDVSGASGQLNVLRDSKAPQTLHRSAGSIAVSSPEGVFIDADLRATSTDRSAAGGRLSVTTSREGLNNAVASGVTAYSTAPRSIELIADGKVADAAGTPGQNLLQALGSGTSRLSAARIRDAGFSDLLLSADDRIVLAQSINLDLSGSITLSSANIVGTGSTASTLRAPVVVLGNLDILPVAAATGPGGEALPVNAAPVSTGGQARLDVDASVIDVVGESGLSGFASVRLSAARDGRTDGEIRLRGRARDETSTALIGSLLFSGELTLHAGQIYPTTLSTFALTGTTGQSSLIVSAPRLAGGAAAPAAPLSALAALAIRADSIALRGEDANSQGGRIRVPFGSLTLDAANRIELADGAELSSSGRGNLVPVGFTQNGRQWFYTSASGAVITLDTLPVAKEVKLSAPALDVSDAATVSSAGGGDMQAWEFVAGVGGSTDTLLRDDLYAIVPGYTFDYAPFDTEVMAGSELRSGTRIELTQAAGGPAAGRYTLLPARYALLPGAYVVSRADAAILTNQQVDVLGDGSRIVSASLIRADSTVREDALQRFMIEPASTFLSKSSYTLTRANSYFEQRATRLGEALGARPADAGRISLSATQPFDWRAAIDLSVEPVTGTSAAGRAGQLDLSVPKLAVVDDGEAAPAGFTAFSAGSLAASGAGSILLGGVRSGTGDRVSIATESSEVRVLADATALSAGEFILVATDAVRIDDGVRIVADSRQSVQPTGTIALSGDGAMVRVSSAAGANVSRGNAVLNGGDLDIGSGAVLTGNEIQLDATGSFGLATDASLNADSLGLGARRIALGTDSPEGDGVAITGDLLTQLGASRAVTLRSYSTIDLAQNFTLAPTTATGAPTLERLVLDAPTLRSLGTADSDVRLRAQEVLLTNTTGRTASVAGTGRLSIEAAPPARADRSGGLEIGTGDQLLAFSDVTVRSQADVILSGSGKLSAAGDLTIEAARVTARSAAEKTVDAAGVLGIGVAQGSSTRGEQVGAGAQVSFVGQKIEQDGVLLFHSGALSLTSRGTDNSTGIRFGASSLTSVQGFSTKAGDEWVAYADAGRIDIDARSGGVRIDGVLNLAALSSGGDGGRLSVRTQGDDDTSRLVLGDTARVLGHGETGGSVSLDLGRVADGQLDRYVELFGGSGSTTGGFNQAFSVRARSGDLSMGAVSLRAEQVSLTADDGSIALGSGAVIDARSATGGVVRVSASDDVAMAAGASIDARSSRVGANGGDVLLSSTDGTVRLGAGARIDASGDDGADGRITLRAGQASGDAKITDAGAVLTAGRLAAEIVLAYEGSAIRTGTSSGSTIGQTTISNDVAALMAQRTAILDRLGWSGRTNAHVAAGVDISSSGSLELTQDWNLAALNDGGEIGFLTLRAAGDLDLRGSLSDGFAGVARTAALSAGDSWSYRLVAGADLDSANLMQTASGAQAGDVKLAGDKVYRTGNGSIEVAAARDVVLGGTTAAPAVIYVAGAQSVLSAEDQALYSGPSNATFTRDGGRVSIVAGRDVTAPASNQLINNWFYRSGRTSPVGTEFLDGTQLAWWSQFSSFRQGVASFGGGDVVVSAGRDVRDLGVMAPTSARMLSSVPDADALRVENGGDITVTADRNILGGMYFVGRGEGRLDAGGSIGRGSAPASNINPLAPVLAQMDGSWSLSANADLELAAAFNPTLFAPATNANNTAGHFVSYSDSAAVRLSSVTGNILWRTPNETQLTNLARASTTDRIAYTVGTDAALFHLAPPTLEATAHGGDIELAPGAEGLSLAATDDGNLRLLAAGDINFWNSVRVMDNDASLMPTVATPLNNNLRNAVRDQILQTRQSTRTDLISTSLRHAGDAERLGVVAGGDIRFTGATAQLDAATRSDLIARGIAADKARLTSPKAAYISAGGDILNIEYIGQHLASTDVTVIQAGGNLLNNNTGNDGIVSIGGSGRLDIKAGRQIDLGQSGGIETVGNLNNGRLAAGGASVSVAAGTAPVLDVSALRARYLDNASFERSSAYRTALVDHVRQQLGLPALDDDQALAAFDATFEQFVALPASSQIAFAEQLLQNEFVLTYLAPGKPYRAAWQAYANRFGNDPDAPSNEVLQRFREDVLQRELWASGTAAAPFEDRASKSAAYASGFRAIELAGYGAPFNFTGDIDLVESKVQTKQGGGIDLFAPGGAVNVGLSAPSTANAKVESDRGVVAFSGGSIRSFSDGDFQVNTQKVFVIGSGDISIWSSNGNIDSGRGANTTVAVPALVPRLTPNGIVFELPPIATGSGIGILQTASGNAQGDVGLFAPNGEVIALDALIRSPGRVLVAAEAVRGADNIRGGSVVGGGTQPTSTSVAGLSSNTNTNQGQTAAGRAAEEAAQRSEKRDPNSILTVELVGLGEESTASGCDEGDEDERCKERATRAN